MRRFLATAATTALLLACGCGGKSYDERLRHTIDDMKYKKRLDENLEAAPKGKFETLLVFVRPPKGFKGPTKEFMLGAQEVGKFDLNDSFIDKDKSLHVFARVKRPKDTSKKKAAPKPEDEVVRGEFNADVIAVLNNFYSSELDAVRGKEVSHGKPPRKFKQLTTEGNGKTVQIYFYGSKTTQFEVALVFEYPKSDQASLVSKIELLLGSFETGERARRSFSGAVTEDEQSEGAPAGGPVSAF